MGEGKGHHLNSGSGKAWNLCKMAKPFWHSNQQAAASERSGYSSYQQGEGTTSVSAVARAFLPARRRLKLDPETKLFFPYNVESTIVAWINGKNEQSPLDKPDLTFGMILRIVVEDEPGKQVSSAIKILNVSRSNVAFKFQTTAPKSCFMRPPSGVLTPGESLIATVFKFVEPPEHPEKQPDRKAKDKFKIVSLKVKGGVEYDVELFDEHKELVAVEQILRVVYLDPQHPTPELEKLKKQLAEAEAALEAQKKPPEDPTPRVVGEGLVIDEWKERRERYLAQQQIQGADSS